MNKEEIKKLKEQQEKRELFKKRYKTAREALLEACKQNDVPYDEVFSKYSEDLCEGLETNKIIAIVDEMKKVIYDITVDFFEKKWVNIFDKSYNDKNKNDIYHTMDVMISREPADTFLSLSKSYDSLFLFCEGKSEEAMKILEDYCAENTFESVINVYGLIDNSKFGDDIKIAYLKGFERNPNVDSAIISAYYKADKEL